MRNPALDHRSLAARRRWAARALCALALLAFALPLAACGKKGKPEPPKGAEEIVYPRPYPDPKTY